MKKLSFTKKWINIIWISLVKKPYTAEKIESIIAEINDAKLT